MGNPTPSRLASFLLQLIADDVKRGEFEKSSDADKRKWMSRFDLVKREQDALLSGDLVKILDVMSDAYGPKPGDFISPP